jgi:hypothetical protein
MHVEHQIKSKRPTYHFSHNGHLLQQVPRPELLPILLTFLHADIRIAEGIWKIVSGDSQELHQDRSYVTPITSADDTEI